MKLAFILCASTALLCSYTRAISFNVDNHHPHHPPPRPRPPPPSSSSSSESDEHHHGGHGGNGRYKRPNGGCGDGWIIFNRKNGRWCVKVFAGAMDQVAAESKCREQEATLTAFMNPEEQKLINDDALRVIPQDMGGIWIGANRTERCLLSPLNSECTADNSFFWTDGSTTGTSGFQWWDLSEMQPDNSWGRKEFCVLYFAAPRAGEWYKYGGYYWMTQRMTDELCYLIINGEGPRRTVGYVCGRKAK